MNHTTTVRYEYTPSDNVADLRAAAKELRQRASQCRDDSAKHDLIQAASYESRASELESGKSEDDIRKVVDDDPIEDVLSGQLLMIYRHLKARTRRTSFDALAKLKKCWRVDEPSEDAIVKALKRLQTELNKVSVSLVIEAKDRRTYLDK